MSEFLFKKTVDQSLLKDGLTIIMKPAIEKILDEYITAKQEPFTGNSLGQFFRNEVPDIFYQTGLVDTSTYMVKGSVGQGNWAQVPWICIFDRSITTSATKGVYIVYLLSKDGERLYLTFNQGCTDIRSKHSKQDTISIMRESATDITSSIDARNFNSDEKINLGNKLTELAELYQKGTIFYKEYKNTSRPSEEELRVDLGNMIKIYQDYVAYKNGELTEVGSALEGGEELLVKDNITAVINYIASKLFSYEEGLIENFYLSLKSKPFVILAGTSGTGKTRLVRLFAEAVGANVANGRFKLVAVRPDWSDSSDLFGHVDLNGNFIPGVILDFIKSAEEDLDNPYFLCLDEMNLARVEYYLSDVLSIIETRELTANGEILSDPLITDTFYGMDRQAAARYGSIQLPENLYIIGTVNMDETTFPFSRKVLDRANTIEFSHVDLMPQEFEPTSAILQTLELPNSFLKAEYLLLAHCMNENNYVNRICSELQDINKILQLANAHVGYRVRDEIVFYHLNNRKYGLLSEDEAMDNAIMQKILPRIQGSSILTKDMLCELFKLCAGDYEGYQTEADDISSKMMRAAKEPDCKYKHSAEKLAYMVRRFEEDGFTSYWL